MAETEARGAAWTTLVGVCALVARGELVLLVRQRRPYGVHWEVPGGYRFGD